MDKKVIGASGRWCVVQNNRRISPWFSSKGEAEGWNAGIVLN